MDIRNIARSDGNFIDQQKKWHDMLANILELNIRISQSSLDDIDGADAWILSKPFPSMNEHAIDTGKI